MNHNTQRIYNYLGEHQNAMIALLKRLVLAESPSDVPETQALPMAIIWEFLSELDYQIHITPGKQSGGYLTAMPKLATSEASQMLIGHCDTVWPVGSLKTMPIDIGDNKMTGPGVYDMKAGLVQMLFTLQAIHDLRLTPSVAPFVLVNSDEEIGSRESRHKIVRLAPKMDRVFVLEPALGMSGKLKTARKGVGRFSVIVTGRAAHAGLDPDKGVSAIWEMANVIQRLQALNEREAGVTVNVGLVNGGLGSNVIAPEATASVDVRVPTLSDAHRIKQVIEAIEPVLDGTTVTITGDFGRMPLERTPANRQLWHLAQEAAAQIGVSIEEGMAGGGSDGNLTSPFTATLDGMGAVGDGAHAAHEFIYLDKLSERGAILGNLLLHPALRRADSVPTEQLVHFHPGT
jgi:glutamate carboxypeptidase